MVKIKKVIWIIVLFHLRHFPSSKSWALMKAFFLPPRSQINLECLPFRMYVDASYLAAELCNDCLFALFVWCLLLFLFIHMSVSQSVLFFSFDVFLSERWVLTNLIAPAVTHACMYITRHFRRWCMQEPGHSTHAGWENGIEQLAAETDAIEPASMHACIYREESWCISYSSSF